MTITTDSTLEVNPKEALPSGAPVDRVVLRYSQPSHGAFFASVMQRLQQPEVSPRQLLEALSTAVDEMEAEEARKAEEEARKIEEEKRREEEEKRRIEEEKRKEKEELQKAMEAQRIEEEKKAEEEAKRIIEETKRAEETKRMEEAGKALEEARKAYEDAKKAQDEARRAEDEAKKAAEQSARSCGVCHSPNPSARAVFATCGHVACLKCAESAAAHSAGRLECPFCAAPTTYMRLFEREMITGVESSPKPSSRSVRFYDKDEVKEFDKDEDVVDTSTVSLETTVSAIPKGGNPLGCGLNNWFGKKN
ncbi:hypothetical protein PRIPAC_72600 [Pristionchus pacificus]|uniref:RING-type domain-containing protein n=1 Tax=Pristionchus pacificus TaxID=54126 RepID=A0A2A6C901_PRIPA|nr:hypothetical protein PRIPAC_72600 [Pristionchus pacificus]|eukprot:PDM74570.1 hypothetical protein PRIPAC_41926 [Pristionchus pacificus]